MLIEEIKKLYPAHATPEFLEFLKENNNELLAKVIISIIICIFLGWLVTQKTILKEIINPFPIKEISCGQCVCNK